MRNRPTQYQQRIYDELQRMNAMELLLWLLGAGAVCAAVGFFVAVIVFAMAGDGW